MQGSLVVNYWQRMRSRHFAIINIIYDVFSFYYISKYICFQFFSLATFRKNGLPNERLNNHFGKSS